MEVECLSRAEEAVEDFDPLDVVTADSLIEDLLVSAKFEELVDLFNAEATIEELPDLFTDESAELDADEDSPFVVEYRRLE